MYHIAYKKQPNFIVKSIIENQIDVRLKDCFGYMKKILCDEVQEVTKEDTSTSQRQPAFDSVFHDDRVMFFTFRGQDKQQLSTRKSLNFSSSIPINFSSEMAVSSSSSFNSTLNKTPAEQASYFNAQKARSQSKAVVAWRRRAKPLTRSRSALAQCTECMTKNLLDNRTRVNTNRNSNGSSRRNAAAADVIIEDATQSSSMWIAVAIKSLWSFFNDEKLIIILFVL